MIELFLENILKLTDAHEWAEIIHLREQIDDDTARKLLWVWPSVENLQFIKKTIEKFDLEGITSIGCGCGLLEWIIQISTGIPIVGYEINADWWNSKYSPPQFIPLQYPKECQKVKSNHALLFCYFNDNRAFNDYLDNYEGSVLIIIGPTDGSGRHSDPQPFKPNFNRNEWTLHDFEEVRNSRDYIAVYVKTKNFIQVSDRAP